jgi:hypothetical protein
MKAKRTAIALNPAKRIAVVLGEQALRTRRGTAAEHADQLTHLLSLMRLPFVSVGVIPADAQRHAIATIGFWIFDNNAVALETPTAAIKVTRPQEIALYGAMFNRLQNEAIHGYEAPVSGHGPGESVGGVSSSSGASVAQDYFLRGQREGALGCVGQADPVSVEDHVVGEYGAYASV